MWKEDRFNGITVNPANMTALLEGKIISKSKKKMGGETVTVKYEMIDTGKYINLRAIKE